MTSAARYHPEIARRTPAEFQRARRAGADVWLVCAYPGPTGFRKFPLPGALPLEGPGGLDARLAELDADSELVFYCRCPDDKTAAQAAASWAERTEARVAVLEGGFLAWTR
jgi:rhodanese-related sulfurtransferase